MSQLQHGRLGREGDMRGYTLEQLQEHLARLRKQLENPQSTDDPRWVQRWIERIEGLVVRKQQALRRRERRPE